MKLTWYGHGTWLIEVSGKKVLLDPFFDENPSAPIKAAEVTADVILVSHGHFDHVADVAAIANRCHSKVIAIYEIATWFAINHKVSDTLGMNIGGTADLEFAKVKMTQAFHSSQLPDGSYGGVPAGFLFAAEGKNIYFACDTALFGDMEIIGASGLDLAVLPIGDLFTMGITDSIEATKITNPKIVAPAHYNTWPPIEQDAEAWGEKIKSETNSTPMVIKPGESFEL
ncbi:MAG: metal-dependent hydrolase [Planctomycetota bacterium]|jgi:L-ascorbate metabolism protein UlaG (beta-lactamase superfamily)|nr:metal-dependent hydrolase [Planctomycetota bacterium]